MAIYIVNALDTVIFTDNPDHKDVIKENIIFSDIAIVTSSQSVYVSDSIKLTTNGRTVYSVNVYDTVSFTEEPSKSYSLYASDTARFADADYRSLIYNVELYDNISLSDNTVQRIDFTDTITDSVGFNDRILHVVSFNINNEAIFEDFAIASVFKAVNDTVTFTDVASVNINYAVNAEDTISFSEAHRFAIRANVFEGIRFIDNTDEVRVRGNIEGDGAVLTDLVNCFDRYKVQCFDEVILSDYIDGEITPYIKWVHDDFVMEDDAGVRADYRVRIKESIIIADDPSAKIRGFGNHNETIEFSDQSHSAVHFSTPLTTNAIARFQDTCSIKISKYNPIYYTNALIAGVGSTEETVYTAGKTTAVIVNMSLANIIAGDITVAVIVYKAGITPINIRIDLPIAEGETFVINKEEESSFIIEEGDEIRVRSSSPASLDVYMAIIEREGIS